MEFNDLRIHAFPFVLFGRKKQNCGRRKVNQFMEFIEKCHLCSLISSGMSTLQSYQKWGKHCTMCACH
ncbi:uncharacterized protein LOC122503812 isoform X2 [Leptopilina heterotoma]|uniref:uncharacterized protein LOC122503812 isoform X2 n=1 Tax=Leptopilina heterotoma TaxID=63436 RepID=UPI001CA8825A|nr:uncharacterized protein LOC122503812 isoform X2 [Leptopilina heterotoma]XP_043470463.1 uncharacterized protein LOC122503812 isoform X2 [Leptopilina heterotoma]